MPDIRITTSMNSIMANDKIIINFGTWTLGDGAHSVLDYG